MNNNIKNTLRTGVIAAVGLAVMSACSDSWDDHYDSIATSANAYDGTTMQALEQEASDFAEIVKATDFDVELNSASSYTIWAPANGTFNKDSLMALVSTDKSGVVKQFVKNHVARYSIPLNLEPQQISLLNSKLYTMSAKDEHKIGDVNISATKNNIKCDNGILHVIDGKLPFQFNLFEFIEAEYNKSTNTSKADSSMYAFLKTADEDSLLENRSVYRGYDEYGEKIWVDSVTLRNNSILRDMEALIYEEDSNYIALVPSVEAYQERYALAKTFLKFNPSMDEGLEYKRTDSLQNNYANRFAMTDLFFNRSQNEFWEDSLKSTQYSSRNWPEHIFYRKAPRTMPREKEINDILAKVGVADSITCSNGIAYTFNEYPISIYEQFFKKIDNGATTLNRRFVDKDTEIKGSRQKVTKNVSGTDSKSGTWTVYKYVGDLIPLYDDDGEIVGYTYDPNAYEATTQSYSYFYVYTSSTQNPNIAFEIGNNFSGRYDIYVVTMPIWFYLNETEGFEITNKKRYRFQAYIWEKDEDGNYPNSGIRLDDGSTNIFETPEPTDIYTLTDTTFIGTYDFKYSYYGEDEPGVILQLNTYITSSLRNTFSYSMLFSGIVLKPHDDDTAPATEIKASQMKALPQYSGEMERQYKKLGKTFKK